MNEQHCCWGKLYHPCHRKPFAEMKSLTGNWSPICRGHLFNKKMKNRNNIFGGLFPIETRPLKEATL